MSAGVQPSAPSPQPKWYYRPTWVLVVLFLVLGPFGLPLLWRSPSFSRPAKILLTVLVVAYFTVLAGETIRLFRVVERDLLGTITDF